MKDVDPWFSILTKPEVLELMRPETPWTRALVRRMVLRARAQAREGSRYELAVEQRSDRTVVGRVALKEIYHGEQGRAVLAYWMHPSVWGTGTASEAVHALCRSAFGPLRLHRLDAEVIAYNIRSKRLLLRLGFQEEGRSREAFRYHGRWISAENFGLLAKELRRLPATTSKDRRPPSDRAS